MGLRKVIFGVCPASVQPSCDLQGRAPLAVALPRRLHMPAKTRVQVPLHHSVRISSQSGSRSESFSAVRLIFSFSFPVLNARRIHSRASSSRPIWQA